MDPREIALAYWKAWIARDAQAFGALLADDVTFEGPRGRASGAEEVLAGFRRFSTVTADGPDVRRLWVDGEDVLTWFNVLKPGQDPMPGCNWMTIKNGRVAQIRVTFDLLPPT